MPSLTAHIINHTHWDREWFLTSVYTSQWIPGLIDSLERLAADNPAFRFFFDGQTLVIEDLLRVAPEYAPRVRKLIRDGNLLIGPYYCQPDWQLTSGELLMRNLAYGLKDVAALGGEPPAAGWLVDTFGHISQSPQIHRLNGIDAVFVWRGVPKLTPYFMWQAPDGSEIFTINLFGGYRNLYGVTHAPQVAVDRLHNEVRKLEPHYPTPDIPLFDGYDLEDNPEDPIRFYTQMQGARIEVDLRESTPQQFAQHIVGASAQLRSGHALPLPRIAGELNSGKYGATFPGTFSARTYLKLMVHDCEHLLFQRCEPLAVMARQRGRAYPADQYEAWTRQLLQNAVHDCICGVSIDQVHEKMEYSYRQMYDAMVEDIAGSLGAIMADFGTGDYAVSTNPMPAEHWQIVGDQLIHSKTDGLGVWPVIDTAPLERTGESLKWFEWKNDHYQARVNDNGTVTVNDAIMGALIVSAEHGDTYSDERGEQLGVLKPTGLLTIEAQNDRCAVIAYKAAWQSDAANVTDNVTANVRMIFDPSPLIKWQIELDSRGTNLRVEMIFETGIDGAIKAGMPFDIVERKPIDTDLLPRQLPDDLASVLLGQRELNAVESFPFHDFIAIDDPGETMAVLAKGVRAYRMEGGAIILTLRRSVEWLTKANLKDRIGDAGPFFYVPDARCERTETHEIAVAFGLAGWTETPEFQSLVASYKNPPLIVQNSNRGKETSWEFLRKDAPMSSLSIEGETALARFYNPTALPLSGISPKQIVTTRLEQPFPPIIEQTGSLQPMNLPAWRVGQNHSAPDPAIIKELEDKITEFEAQAAEIEARLASAPDAEKLLLQHRYYIVKRESVEFQLSLALNQRKIAQGGAPSYKYLYELDHEIAEIGLKLNQLRIKRRIFDYVVQVANARSKAGS